MTKIKNILITDNNIEKINELDLPLSKLINFALENYFINNNIETIKRRFHKDETNSHSIQNH